MGVGLEREEVWVVGGGKAVAWEGWVGRGPEPALEEIAFAPNAGLVVRIRWVLPAIA